MKNKIYKIDIKKKDYIIEDNKKEKVKLYEWGINKARAIQNLYRIKR